MLVYEEMNSTREDLQIRKSRDVINKKKYLVSSYRIHFIIFITIGRIA